MITNCLNNTKRYSSSNYKSFKKFLYYWFFSHCVAIIHGKCKSFSFPCIYGIYVYDLLTWTNFLSLWAWSRNTRGWVLINKRPSCFRINVYYLILIKILINTHYLCFVVLYTCSFLILREYKKLMYIYEPNC